MAITTKKGSKNKKAKLRRPVVKTSEQAQTMAELRQQLAECLQRESTTASENVRLFKELQERNAELREALEHQTATTEVLGIISRSPTDVQPVLDAIVESAARVCGVDDVTLRLREGDMMVARAHIGPVPIFTGREAISVDELQIRWVSEHGTLHIPDIRTRQNDFPTLRSYSRTFLIAPFRQRGELTGTLIARRTEVRPFTPAQIKLLETFADQAVIAIENVRLFNELKESLEQQTATSEILGVIASSPTDIQPVLNAVAESAARLCDATDAVINQIDGATLRMVAHHGPIPALKFGEPLVFNRSVVHGRAIIDRKTIHVYDVAAEVETEYPDSKQLQQLTGTRTILATPLLREGEAIGVINIRRTEVRPFTDKQIKLLETFADQAVIAIENVRLFKEIQERNAELRDALEHQTATSEVLSIISRSPTDVQPVLDEIVASAARVCGIDDVHLRLRDREVMVSRAHFGSIPIARAEVSIDVPSARWMREHGALHIPDVRAQNDFPIVVSAGRGSVRTFLLVPLSQQGELIGTLAARRTEVRPFTPAQIKLLETFANQAVIAIENVRLFQELKESLEQQTATSEILGVIASSPTDIQPVLDTVAENAARVCGAEDAVIFRLDGDVLRLAAWHGTVPLSTLVQEKGVKVNRATVSGRSVVDRHTIHVRDIAAEFEGEFPEARPYQQQVGWRTTLATPLLREAVPIGAIHIRRMEVRPFSDKQIKLLETFAAQAVIAIENVRLFKEIQERNTELREALEHQTATAEVLGIISRSPTDVQPVLDAIVESAARVCGIDNVGLRLREGKTMVSRAHFGPIPVPIGRVEMSIDEPWFRWIREHGTLHVPDVRAAQNDFPTLGSISGFRSFLAAPLRQHGEFIGILTGRRIEVRPFTLAQIKLLETFADQAVIAIENVRLFQELKESLEQQTATSEILGVIASSPTDIQPVLDVVAENAARLCDASDALILRVAGDTLQTAARFGPIASAASRVISRGFPGGRAVIDQQTIHVHDMAAAVETEFPDARILQQISSTRTTLATPLLREGISIGSIVIRRQEVRPFSEKQIALLKTFADQAVIAIENVRLFKELQERNAELREALEHQTATAEVLGIISRSPTDVQPVLDAIVESAARVCGIDDLVLRLREGSALIPRAHFGSVPPDRVEVNIDALHIRWMREHGALHIPDVRAQNDFPMLARGREWRTFLAAPLRQQGDLIGLLAARRTEVRPFTPAQIKLLETFADQAVIALENVRLFQELKEALEQQTATSQILGVIASSPTDIQPVLDTIAENAARVCGSYDALIRLVEGDKLRLAAHYGPVAPGFGLEQPLTRDSVGGRAVIDCEVIHIEDLMAVAATEFPEAVSAVERMGGRTILAAPLLREGVAIGAIYIRRKEVRPFTDKQIKLLETFASQAVIAIENVRLFQELKESLEQQTATSKILGVIASSPTDIQPVLDVVAENAAKLCDAADAVITRVDSEGYPRTMAAYGSIPVPTALVQTAPVSRSTPAGRAFIDGKTIHVHDLAAELETEFTESKTRQQISGTRTILATPLVREGVPIGTVVIRRTEVRPFTDKQIKLLETFAAQAVIAIENVRLFKEIQQRNAELREALEHQTATAEVLGIISRSPTDVQPVLDAIVESAARVCGIDDVVLRLHEGNTMVVRAHFGPVPVPASLVEVSSDLPRFRWMREHGTLHIPDVRAQNEFPLVSPDVGWRTHLSVPLRQQGELIGTLAARRTEVRPFTPAQIKLLETFADQAVIAIENVRLFKELEIRNRDLTEALEQQTATSEVLKVISRSTFDLQPVLETLIENATRLCGADSGFIFRSDGELLRSAVAYNVPQEFRAFLERNPIRPGRGTTTGRVALERRVVHIPDLTADPEYEFPEALTLGRGRATLGVPMLREGNLIGVILIRGTEVRPFTDKQIELVTTFADQAVIAIENVRLFQEVEARTRELARSVGELKALGEVGQAVSSTLDLQTVLSTIVGHAVQLSGTSSGVIYEYDDATKEFHLSEPSYGT